MFRRTSVALLLGVALAIGSVVVAQDDGSRPPAEPQQQPAGQPVAEPAAPADPQVEQQPAAREPEQPAAQQASSRSRARLVKPWSDLATLSPEQKARIIEIHADAVARMNQIRRQEEADILALLTAENKAELDALKAKQRAEAKARRARTTASDNKDAADDDPTKDR